MPRGRYFETKQFPPAALYFSQSAIASLRAREAELARVQRIGRVGGYEVDLQAGFSSLRSPEYLELHNLPPEAVNEPHEAWVRRLHPDDRERVDQFFRDTVASDALAYESEYRIVTPDGQTRWISSVARSRYWSMTAFTSAWLSSPEEEVADIVSKFTPVAYANTLSRPDDRSD